MKCDLHEIEMEWVPVDDPYCFPDGGYWDCEMCDAEEEAFRTTPETVGTEADWGPWELDDDDVPF